MVPGKAFYLLLWLAVLGLFAREAAARELQGSSVGVVPQAMGKAYTALADDWLALHYNPAGLALARGADFQVFDLRVEGNQDTVSSYSNVSTLSNSSTSTAEKLNLLMGKHVLAQVGNVTQFTIPYFAAALTYDMKVDLDLQNASYPVTELTYRKDFGIHTGGAISFGRAKQFRLGTAVKFLQRTGGTQMLGIDEIISSTNSSLLSRFTMRGSGIGVSAGMQYTVPLKARGEFTLGWAWQDIGRTSFGSFANSSRPSPIESNMTVGMGLRFPIGGKVNRRLGRRFGQPRSVNHISLAVDYSHLEKSPSQEHFPKHMHYGVNLDLPLFSIQAGVNQTSLTFGLGLDLGMLRVQAATYGEELGGYAGQRRDRRYLLSLGTSLGVGK